MLKNLNTKLVLFDLDGTLVDTAPDFVTSLNNILKKHGRDVLDFEHVRSFVSEGSAKFTEIGFKINQYDPNFQIYRNEFLKEYKKNLLKVVKGSQRVTTAIKLGYTHIEGYYV